MPGTGRDAGADAVPIDRRVLQRGDHELVQVAGHDDPGPGGAELVEQRACLPGLLGQVPRVDAYGAQPGTGDLHRCSDAVGDVEGVHEQRGVGALRLDLAAERGLLALVGQDERMRGGAHGGDAVATTGCEVAGRGEPGEVGGTGGCDRGLLVGTPAAHLDQGSSLCGGHHPGRRAGDRRVVVEDAEHQRLQRDALAEAAGDGEDRAAGEVQVALRVGIDVAGEPEVTQVGGGRLADDALLAQPADLVVAVPECLDQVQQPAQAAEEPVTAAVGELAGEGLEHRPVVHAAVVHPRAEHGELVAIGQHAGGEVHRRHLHVVRH